MPEWRDESTGRVMVWDPTSKSYVVADGSDVDPNVPDRSHATGGDNDLFDPAVHSEKTKNPELEGYVAAVSGDPHPSVVCPNCKTQTEERECPQCHQFLSPEWAKEGEPELFFGDGLPQHKRPRTDHWSDPERVPKTDLRKRDESFPSMIS